MSLREHYWTTRDYKKDSKQLQSTLQFAVYCRYPYAHNKLQIIIPVLERLTLFQHHRTNKLPIQDLTLGFQTLDSVFFHQGKTYFEIFSRRISWTSVNYCKFQISRIQINDIIVISVTGPWKIIVFLKVSCPYQFFTEKTFQLSTCSGLWSSCLFIQGKENFIARFLLTNTVKGRIAAGLNYFPFIAWGQRAWCGITTQFHIHICLLIQQTSEDSKHRSLTEDFHHLVSHNHTKQRGQKTGVSPITKEDSVTTMTKWGWPTWQLSIPTVSFSGTSTSVSSACRQAFINTQSMYRVLCIENWRPSWSDAHVDEAIVGNVSKASRFYHKQYHSLN